MKHLYNGYTKIAIGSIGYSVLYVQGNAPLRKEFSTTDATL
jgi:hypothetical protein